MLPAHKKFWDKVQIADEDSCWLWQAAKDSHGYGAFRYQGKRVTASRLAYFLTYPEGDRNLFVLHRCDNPSCCNPKHLFLGTHRENMQDKLNKGRPNGGGPERVKPETVAEVKRLKAIGTPWAIITQHTGAAPSTIHRILRGRYG